MAIPELIRTPPVLWDLVGTQGWQRNAHYIGLPLHARIYEYEDKCMGRTMREHVYTQYKTLEEAKAVLEAIIALEGTD